jgi:phenylacetate-CoA ligase
MNAISCLKYLEGGLRPFDHLARVTFGSGNPFFWCPGLFRSGYISMHEEKTATLRGLKEMKPDMLSSYPSVLMLLAHRNLSSGIGLKVRSVLSNAEVLSKHTRELIKTSFGCDLRDTYGTIEAGSVAWECEHGSMHINSDSVFVEVVDDKGNPVKTGRHGHLLLTPLWKRSMPIIRYKVGDWAALGSRCRCGRGSHVIKDIVGRCDDFLTMPSGKVCTIPLDAYIRYSDILQFQGVQERPGHLCIKIVPKKGFSVKTQDKIIRELKSLFSEPMDIEVEVVDEIKRGRSYKLRTVISKVKPDFSSV